MFLPWHRLYVVQMELAMNDGETPGNKIGMPYWDWTKNNEIPGLATQGPWQRAHTNGAEMNQYDLTYRNFDFLDKEMLAGLVKTAFEEETNLQFNIQISVPHDHVHDEINGTMGRVSTASYDPIFYLHHSYVDYQYAYWQVLQKLRGNPIKFHFEDWHMQPFASPEVNKFDITLKKSTPKDGLGYENAFKYKFDELLFQGKTPQEFHEEEMKQEDRLYIGISIKNKAVTSRIYFNLMRESEILIHDVGYVAVFGETKGATTSHNDKNHRPLILYDVTNKLGALATLASDKTLQFNVSHYEDSYENPLPLANTYRPFAVHKHGRNRQSTNLRLKAAHVQEYNPNIVQCNLDTTVEFLNADGSFSTGVKLVDSGKEQSVDGAFGIRKLENNFKVPIMNRKHEYAYIDIGYDINCHVEVLEKFYKFYS